MKTLKEIHDGLASSLHDLAAYTAALECSEYCHCAVCIAFEATADACWELLGAPDPLACVVDDPVFAELSGIGARIAE